MSSWAGSNMQNKVKFSKNIFLLHTKYMVIISMRPVAKIVNFVAPGPWVRSLRWDDYEIN